MSKVQYLGGKKNKAYKMVFDSTSKRIQWSHSAMVFGSNDFKIRGFINIKGSAVGGIWHQIFVKQTTYFPIVVYAWSNYLTLRFVNTMNQAFVVSMPYVNNEWFFFDFRREGNTLKSIINNQSVAVSGSEQADSQRNIVLGYDSYGNPNFTPFDLYSFEVDISGERQMLLNPDFRINNTVLSNGAAPIGSLLGVTDYANFYQKR